MDRIKITKPAVILLLLTCLFSTITPGCSHSALSTDHTTERIEFDSGKFHLVGDLKKPVSGKVFPVVVLVHGDGRATRTQNGFYFPTMDIFLRAGYAVFSYDKPGFGKSTGEFDEEWLRHERADILSDAVELLAQRDDIETNRIGVWGISQAGWVMPLAIEKTKKLSFMIVVSGGAESGTDQMGYLLRSEALCAGYPENEAAELDSMWVACMEATTYDEYAILAQGLVAHPVVIATDCMCCVTERDHWTPKRRDGEGFLDPMPIIERCGIPVLALFGENDTAVDPVQGLEAYEKALKTSDNPQSRVVLIHGVDHDMIPAETGCPAERRRRTWSDWCNPSQEYLEQLAGWLALLP